MIDAADIGERPSGLESGVRWVKHKGGEGLLDGRGDSNQEVHFGLDAGGGRATDRAVKRRTGLRKL